MGDAGEEAADYDSQKTLSSEGGDDAGVCDEEGSGGRCQPSAHGVPPPYIDTHTDSILGVRPGRAPTCAEEGSGGRCQPSAHGVPPPYVDCDTDSIGVRWGRAPTYTWPCYRRLASSLGGTAHLVPEPEPELEPVPWTFWGVANGEAWNNVD